MTFLDYYLLWAGSGLFGVLIAILVDYYSSLDTKLGELVANLSCAVILGPIHLLMALWYFIKHCNIFDKVIIKGRRSDNN